MQGFQNSAISREEVVNQALEQISTEQALLFDALEEIGQSVQHGSEQEVAFQTTVAQMRAGGTTQQKDNNIQMAYANVQEFMRGTEDRDLFVDGSIFGMGRGAGNARTELLADYLNKHCGTNYNVQVLLETIDKYIVPVLDHIHWGYDLPMFICGTKHSHVDNVNHLKKTDARLKKQYNIQKEAILLLRILC